MELQKIVDDVQRKITRAQKRIEQQAQVFVSVLFCTQKIVIIRFSTKLNCVFVC